MRTFKICLLSNVQACNPGLLTIVTSLYAVFLGLNCFLTGPLYLLKISIHSAHFSTPPLANTNLFSVSVSMSFLFICFLRFHIWVRSYSAPFSVTYSTKHSAFRVHQVAANSRISFPLCLNDVPLYVHPALSTPVHPSTDTWALGCIHVWATVNDAVINLGVHISFQVSVSIFFSWMLRSGIDGLYGSSSFNFLRNLHTVSTVAVPVRIPTAQSFPFLSFSSASYLLSDNSHSERCEVTARRAFAFCSSGGYCQVSFLTETFGFGMGDSRESMVQSKSWQTYLP